MVSERNIQNEFINYLVSHGYPKESIICDWRVSNIIVDVAILDLDTYLPVAIYEIKVSSNPNIEMSINQLKKIASQIKYPVRMGIVLGSEEISKFKVIDVTDEVHNSSPRSSISREESINIEPVKYEFLSNLPKAEFINEVRVKKNKLQKIFRIICWGLIPLYIVVLMILDGTNIYPISYVRLILLGIGIGVVLIPFFSEIKVGDVSLRLSENNKKERNVKDKDELE